MIRMGLVDDQELVRIGIAQLISLSDTISLAWQAANGVSALDMLEKTPVDILVSDIRMPNMDGLQLAKEIRKMGNKTPILMLTTFDEKELFVLSLSAGANGFLLKDVSFEKLQRAIILVSKGGIFAEPQLIKSTTDSLNGLPSNKTLSEKECQILRFVAAGFSNKEIANAVFLAEGTVKNHVSNIIAKLDCRDRTQAVLKAMQWSLI